MIRSFGAPLAVCVPPRAVAHQSGAVDERRAPAEQLSEPTPRGEHLHRVGGARRFACRQVQLARDARRAPGLVLRPPPAAPSVL